MRTSTSKKGSGESEVRRKKASGGQKVKSFCMYSIGLLLRSALTRLLKAELKFSYYVGAICLRAALGPLLLGDLYLDKKWWVLIISGNTSSSRSWQEFSLK